MSKTPAQHTYISHSIFVISFTATKKGKAFVEIEEDHSDADMDTEEAEEVWLG